MTSNPEAPDDSTRTTCDVDAAPSIAERRVGPYRLLRELGHGGMGTVYLAARADDQYQKRVAIKIIRGLDSQDVVRHFRRERQILASLDHPNIARLLDGGTTDDGLPYCVMEYVEGQRIDTYCDEHGLSTRERLQLFQGVCAAVAYAHHNLVIHRDLKPGNILVTLDGSPKLLDFGIARFLNPEAAGDVPTVTGLAMTPDYASPEQARGRPLTTATDVYSLGVVLYELLTGCQPYRTHCADPLAMLRVVCEEEVETPSTAVGRRDDTQRQPTAESVSRTHSATPERLRRLLRGDLDNVLLAALRKEPQRRYGSVEALSEDIRRYLEGQPVRARKATFVYRAGKFLRRNVAAVGAAAIMVLLGLAFVVMTLVQSRRVAAERDLAEIERAKAERLAAFMVDLFKVSSPSEARGNTVTAREVLDNGAERILGQLKEEPEIRAALMASIGNVYSNLGLLDRARPLLEQSLEIRRRVLNREHPDLVAGLADLGWVHVLQGNDARAEALLGEAVAIERKRSGGRSVALAASLNMLGGVALQRGNCKKAGIFLREALALRRELLGDDHPDVEGTLSNLGLALSSAGDFAGAEPVLRECLERSRRRNGDNHPRVLSGLTNLAGVLGQMGRLDEAEALFREALEVSRRLYEKETPNVARALNNMGWILYRKKDYAAAEVFQREALAIRSRVLGQDNVDTAESRITLGEVLLDAGRPREAERLIRRGLAIQRQLRPDRQEAAAGEATLGRCLVALRRFDEAEPLLLRSYGQLAARFPEEHDTRVALEALVSLYDSSGRPEKAAEYRTRRPAETGAAGPTTKRNR